MLDNRRERSHGWPVLRCPPIRPSWWWRSRALANSIQCRRKSCRRCCRFTLSPILPPPSRVARRFSALAGLGHTCVIHAKDDARIREFAMRMPAFRVLANTSSPQGSTGITTNVFPAMTLGCGAVAGNITSDNIGPLNLINVKRLAYVARKAEEAFETRGAFPRFRQCGPPDRGRRCGALSGQTRCRDRPADHFFGGGPLSGGQARGCTGCGAVGTRSGTARLSAPSRLRTLCAKTTSARRLRNRRRSISGRGRSLRHRLATWPCEVIRLILTEHSKARKKGAAE